MASSGSEVKSQPEPSINEENKSAEKPTEISPPPVDNVQSQAAPTKMEAETSKNSSEATPAMVWKVKIF